MDCINREEVKMWFCNIMCGRKPYDCRADDHCDDYNRIDSLPTTEIPPVTPQQKTGRWIFKAFDEETGISNSYWCSACNYPMAQVYDDYCAHCGAKMEREGEKNNADNT